MSSIRRQLLVWLLGGLLAGIAVAAVGTYWRARDEANALFDHQEQPQFIYEHVWRPRDLLMWDNRCTLHARTDFSATERRLMRRLTILGEKPI